MCVRVCAERLKRLSSGEAIGKGRKVETLEKIEAKEIRAHTHTHKLCAQKTLGLPETPATHVYNKLAHCLTRASFSSRWLLTEPQRGAEDFP